MVKNPLWFLLIFIGVVACNDKPTFPVTPIIELNEFYFKDIENLSLDSLIIKIKFEDGDGDLGLESFETNPPYQLLDPVTTGPPTSNPSTTPTYAPALYPTSTDSPTSTTESDSCCTWGLYHCDVDDW